MCVWRRKNNNGPNMYNSPYKLDELFDWQEEERRRNSECEL